MRRDGPDTTEHGTSKARAHGLLVVLEVRALGRLEQRATRDAVAGLDVHGVLLQPRALLLGGVRLKHVHTHSGAVSAARPCACAMCGPRKVGNLLCSRPLEKGRR